MQQKKLRFYRYPEISTPNVDFFTPTWRSSLGSPVCVCVCVCVVVCVGDNVCMCVCVREGERESESEWVREREILKPVLHISQQRMRLKKVLRFISSPFSPHRKRPRRDFLSKQHCPERLWFVLTSSLSICSSEVLNDVSYSASTPWLYSEVANYSAK